MKVLLAAAEVAPIIKMGGLGDVIGALPKALETLKVDADVIVPFYTNIDTNEYRIVKQFDIQVPYGGETYLVPIYRTKLPGSNVDVFLVKNDDFFDKKKGYLLNEVVPYSFFNRAVVEFIKMGFNIYDVIHCHDWHTGLIPHLLTDELGTSKPPVLFTIHNISYQGNVEDSILKDIDLDPGEHRGIEYDIQDGFLNFMQQAVTTAEFVSTVSPSYANEIVFKDIGGEMSSFLYDRRSRLTGILNGIDYSTLPRSFSKSNWKEGKSKARENISKLLNLDLTEDTPIFSFISRLDPNQKGLDILMDSIDEILKNDGAFILLGTGDPIWESKFTEAAKEWDKNYKGKVSINIKFDNKLALDIYAGSNFFLVPSRFEPCGLTQMISMHYGTLPIVRDTGGLKDSVIDSVNGFKFKLYNSSDLKSTISRALKFYNNKKTYEKMVSDALSADFNWKNSASEYKKLYRKLVSSF